MHELPEGFPPSAAKLPNSLPNLAVNVARKTFEGREILRDVSFAVNSGEVVALVGPSGSGKTTLLRIIAGLDKDYVGSVLVGAQKVTTPSRRVGIVFQDARLLPWLNVESNVGLGVRKSLSDADRQKAIRDALTSAGLEETRHAAWPLELSGGEVRRVAFARAVGGSPEVLLLDEPFSALDALSRDHLYSAVMTLLGRTLGKSSTSVGNLPSIVLVTHDTTEAARIADRVLVLSRDTPTTVVAELSTDIPRPRLRADQRVQQFAERIVEAVLKSNTAQPADQGVATQV